MMLVLSADAYRRQYGFDSCAPMIANLYGPEDNFDLEDSHVIAAMIRKFVEADDRGDERSSLWGTGRPSREFLYVDDAARALLLAAEHARPLRAGQRRHRRRDAHPRPRRARSSELVGHARRDRSGTPSRPDGQPTRYLDVSRAREWLGFEAETPLRVGLERTIESFREQASQVA